MPRASRATRKLFLSLIGVLTISLIIYVASSKSFNLTRSKSFKVPHFKSFKLPSFPGTVNLRPAPKQWRYPTRGGQIVTKNGSSVPKLDPAPYDPRYPTRKALVLASFSMQNIDWMEELRSDWEVTRYVLDDPNPHNGLTVPRNQGREAMAYLTYIIDNYHNLPNFTVFHHGHRRAWHQPEPTPLKLRALNLTALSREHYINFRCAPNPGCTKDTVINIKNPKPKDPRVHALLLPKFWDTMFGGDSNWDFGAPPSALSVPCCAQFAVTREAIRAHPLEFWRAYRRPLERDISEFKDIWGDTSGYYLGICYEKLWHIVFGHSETYCPNEDYCRKVQFSDAVVCDRNTGAWEDVSGWESIECISKYQDD